VTTTAVVVVDLLDLLESLESCACDPDVGAEESDETTSVRVEVGLGLEVGEGDGVGVGVGVGDDETGSGCSMLHKSEKYIQRQGVIGLLTCIRYSRAK
jgi:hypothetical protein